MDGKLSGTNRAAGSSLSGRVERPRFSPVGRWLLTIAGTFSVALGLLGIVLPLLPTTPFLLLAAACYLRSSPRLYRWLLANRWTGGYIRDYREGRGMPRRGKITVLALTAATLVVSAYLVAEPLAWLALGLVALGILWFVLSIPTLPTDARQGRDGSPS